MAQLHYQSKRGGWTVRYLKDEKTAKSVMTHIHTEATLYDSKRNKIGEVYWHTDQGADCYERIGHAHWCWWFDGDALTD